jgi:hypothetical protein
MFDKSLDFIESERCHVDPPLAAISRMNDRYIGHRSNQLEQLKVAVMMFSEGIFGRSRWLCHARDTVG